MFTGNQFKSPSIVFIMLNLLYTGNVLRNPVFFSIFVKKIKVIDFNGREISWSLSLNYTRQDTNGVSEITNKESP